MPIRVVNTTPNTLSDETRQDSEASVSANPANPQQIAVSAFTPDPAGSGSAPIYVSTDGGATWALNICVPGGNTTGDISLRFSGSDGRLYAGILRGDNGNMDILRAASFPPVGLMTVLIDRSGPDQPWVEAAWAGAGGNATQDRVYVTANTGTAEAQFSLNAAGGAAPSGFGGAVDIEARTGSDRPSVRTAVHRAGGRVRHVHRRALGRLGRRRRARRQRRQRRLDGAGGPGRRARGPARRHRRHGAAGGHAAGQRARELAHHDRGRPAQPPARVPRLVRRQPRPTSGCTCGAPTTAGRPGPPTCGDQPGHQPRPRGQHPRHGRAALPAADDAGRRQPLRDPPRDLRRPLRDRRARTWCSRTCADQGGTFQPTIGDYANLVAVGKDFHGAFCGFNRRSPANFPNGVTYLRNADFPNQRLLGNDGVTVRPNSIDPFYVFFSDVAPANDVFVRDWTDSPTSFDTGVEPSIRPGVLGWPGRVEPARNRRRARSRTTSRRTSRPATGSATSATTGRLRASAAARRTRRRSR